jgi:hypothetical protein
MMLHPEEDDSSNRHLDEGRKGQWFADIDKLLQLLRSTEFVGTFNPEHHSHYLKAFDYLSSPKSPNKEENGRKRKRNMDEEIQKLTKSAGYHETQSRIPVAPSPDYNHGNH